LNDPQTTEIRFVVSPSEYLYTNLGGNETGFSQMKNGRSGRHYSCFRLLALFAMQQGSKQHQNKLSIDVELQSSQETFVFARLKNRPFGYRLAAGEIFCGETALG
jgi:hypothetical protein